MHVLRRPTTWGEKSTVTPHVASFVGDLFLLESIVLTEYCANLRDANGATPLHHAAFGGYLDCVRFLLENGTVIDSVDRNGISALHIACFQGHLPVVKALLLYGAQINLADNIGETPLHKASLYNHSDCVAHLLANGAEVDARTKENKTALHLTSQLGFADCVKNLLAASASVDLTDNEKRTALHIAALYGYEHCVEHLLQHSASVHLRDSKGATALHNAAYRGFDKIIELLVNARGIAEVLNFADEEGITALHHVCFSGHTECTKILIGSLCSKFSGEELCDAVSVQAKTGMTPLHLACFEGHVDCTKALLESKVRVNAVDDEKSTALHKATFRGHEACVIALVEIGKCDVNLADDCGDTALHKAAYGGYDECVDFLVQNGADIDARDNKQCIPAHNAAAMGHVSCLDKLISDTNVNFDNNKGRSPLHLAVVHGQLEAVQYLMTKQNVDINLEDAKGHSPLYLAIEHAHESIVHDLILEDADVSESCIALVSQLRVLISQATIDSFIEEKNNRAKMKNLQDPKTRTIIRQLVALFNSKPKKGLQALIEKGVVGKSPAEIAEFLHNTDTLNKMSIGELLGEEEFHDIRRAFTDYMHFEGMDFEPALRMYLSTFRLPGEAQKIDRLMECFADRFYSQSEEAARVFADKDACYILAFAVIMLNTDAHNPAIKKQNKMTKQQFITNNRGINNGNDVDHAYLERIYDGIVEKPIKMNADTSAFTNAEKKGFLTKQGGRVKTWKKRWFVLTNNNLYYFRSDTDEKNPLGWIPLENLTITIEKKSNQNRYILIIQSSIPGKPIKSCKLMDGQPVPGSHNRFIIAAASAEEMQEWYDVLTSGTTANPYQESIQNKLKNKRNGIQPDVGKSSPSGTP